MAPTEKIYNFIVRYTTEHLYSPSVQDICDGVGYSSKSTVCAYLRTIEKLGLISLGDFAQPRRIKLIGFKLVKDDSK